MATASLAAIAAVLSVVTLFSHVAVADLNGCNVTDPTTNETISLDWLENFGNVSDGLNQHLGSVFVSPCVASNVTAFDGANCGPAFFALIGADCASSTLFTTLSRGIAVVDNRTTLVVYSGSGGVEAFVSFKCQAGLSDIRIGNVTEVGTQYNLTITSEVVCAGYQPAQSASSSELSKGAIVGIIIGIVAVVVIAAAVFQWRAKSSGDDYQRL